jgi:hypothetical protein
MGDVERAIQRACAFLAAAQDKDGLWHDSELEGEGSDFVTAYVARCLWAVLSMPGLDWLERVFDAACHGLSQRQRPNGGWAYSRETDTDAEATAWALICLLDQRDRRGFSTTRARRYLEAHRDPESGGFRLYVPPVDGDASPDRVRVPDEFRQAHPDVTGAVLRALVARGESGLTIGAACAYLKRVQGEDGLWGSPLWTGRAAPTYLALSALDMAHDLDDATRSAAREGVTRLLKESSDYELAAALVSAPRLSPPGGMGDAVARLLAEQGEDGSWTPTRRLRASPVAHGATDAVRPIDLAYRGRLLTTVTAVTALYFSGELGVEAYTNRLGASLPPNS